MPRLSAALQPDAGGKDFIESLNPNSLNVATAFVWYISQNCRTIGNAPNASSRWTESKELIVIKVLNAHLVDAFKLELDFSDHTHGVFDASAYLASRSGPLLDKLRDPAYFKRFFIDAGALCWPNGLEISPARLRELCVISATA